METPTESTPLEKDLQIIVILLKESIPVYDELLEVLEKNNGWLPLKNEFINLFSELDTPWCILYEDKKQLTRLATQTISREEADDKNNDIDAAENNEIQQNLFQDTHIQLASFFNYLALMIHGRSMCQLITDAKDGDDVAFCLAVQIDRTVLQLPCFQKRLLKSQFSDDDVFLEKLASRIRTPILQSKIRYRTLMLTFAILDVANMLYDLPLEKLLDICEAIGVTGGENGIDDVDKLAKRRLEYKEIARN
ncbi:MAG: hypothetical protein GXP14_16545 [Gammaproteobacteria bacterium]|nr:hypothetical protein [Gammaproteobacteria bacterium]